MSAVIALSSGCATKVGYAITEVCAEWRGAIVKPSEKDTTETIVGIDKEWDVHDAVCPK